MSRIVEIGVLTLGGLSLFGVSFVGFAAATGTPMNEVAIIGGLFETREDPGVEGPSPTQDDPEPIRPENEVFESQAGMLSSWRLDPRFSNEDLEGLVNELKARKIALDLRDEELTTREARVAEKTETLDEQFQTLQLMRDRLETFEADLALRELELTADESAEAERKDSYYANIAKILEAGDAGDQSKRLLDYTPAEAARILRKLKPKRSTELLNELRKPDFKTYADAFAALGE